MQSTTRMPSEALTKNEKLTLALSTIAIVVSVASLPATYYYLQNSVREQSLKSRALEASGGYSLMFDLENPDNTKTTYRVTVENKGTLAVEGVTLSYQHFGSGFAGVKTEAIRFDRPFGASVELSDENLRIVFPKPFPPGERVSVSLPLITGDPDEPKSKVHPYAWISSDSSPSVPITWTFTGAGI